MATAPGPRPAALTAAIVADLLRGRGMRRLCITSEIEASGVPATVQDEGLRIVDGGDPVRMHYAIPGGNDGAIDRRGEHMRWLYRLFETGSTGPCAGRTAGG